MPCLKRAKDIRSSWGPLALAAILGCETGCSWMWPTVIPSAPREPLFHTGFPLVGGLRLDGALCSLVSLGADATREVSLPETTDRAVPLEQVCQPGVQPTSSDRGRWAELVRVSTSYGLVDGYLFADLSATGLVVAFSGLGSPAGGWVNRQFAEVGARQGLTTFAPVRDESPRPIYFDPLREARRGLEAALQIQAACEVGPPGDLAFLGVSLGGLEALLANREALGRGLTTRAVVLDPVLDVGLAVANLDSFWHGPAVDAVQGYFRRLLAGRYGEDPPPKFEEILSRTASHPEALSDLRRDTPSAWLCQARRDAYVVFLSDTDPALGDAQRAFAISCGLPLRRAGAPGHTPLACRLELFEELIGELRPGGVGPGEPAQAPRASLEPL